ncbi:MAG: RimK family alpha-L-glutamate ligase [Clostridia bacterium]|nr:RimK family alpha-L-glutamate ligase [Clostridia bacterium]
MKLWIIYSKIVLDPKKNNALSWMEDEAKALDIDVKILFTEDIVVSVNKGFDFYHQGIKVDLPDAVFTRCYDQGLLEHFEMAGIKTFNHAKAMADCLDKWKTHQLLTKANLPTPKTFFTEHDVSFDFLKEALGIPFIVKDIYGKKGEQVFLIKDLEGFEEALRKCQMPLYQEYVQASFGKDIRVHVIGNKAVTSVLRVSQGDFKSNFSQGGSALSHDLTPEIAYLAEESAKALNLDFAGVDIMFTETGYTICEVNGVPGFRTIGLTSKYNIPKAMLSHIKEQMK